MPYTYNRINLNAGTYSPSTIKSYNNQSYWFWQRSLFQRACSNLIFELPTEWGGSIRDFFYFSLFQEGFLAVFESDEFGTAFQPCGLSGFNFYYQPTDALIANPKLQKTYKIGKDCELIKLNPDYRGIFDVINYYAEKLSQMDSAVNMSIVNSKFAWMLGAKNKSAAEAIKKMFDEMNKGNPLIVYDKNLLLEQDDKSKDSPVEFIDRQSIANSYITDKLLQDFQTLLNNFDAEIGIPTIPYAKKERMVTSEADSRIIDSTSRSVVMLDTLQSSIDKVNSMFPDLNLSVKLRYDPTQLKEGGDPDVYGKMDIVRDD